MTPLLLITLGVVLAGTASMSCLRRGLTVPKVIGAVFAAAVTGGVYVVVSELVLSGFPSDSRYYSMDMPRFAFQGGFVGTLVGLVTVFVRCAGDLSEPRQRL